MRPSGVGHVLVNDLGHADSRDVGVEAQPFTDAPNQCFAREPRRQIDAGCSKGVGVKPAKLQVGVGDRGVLPAERVRSRAGLGPRALRADPDLVEHIDAGNRSAASTDLDHVDHGNRDRHPAPLLEARCAVDFEGLGGRRTKIIDQADLRCRASHVEREHPVACVASCKVSSKNCSTGWARLNEPHGKRRCALDAHQAATGVHEVERATDAALQQFVAKPNKIGRHQRLDVGVRANGVEPLKLTHLWRHLTADRHRDIGKSIEE